MAVLDRFSRNQLILMGIGAVLLLIMVIVGWQGIRAWGAWRSIERVPFDVELARASLPVAPFEDDVLGDMQETRTYEESESAYTAILVLGSDEDPAQEGIFSDAILLYLLPSDGGGPTVVSVPRDTIVIDACTGAETKINRTLDPCDASMSGPERVALSLETYTRIPTDHFALLKFDAFVGIIDALGGVELCVDYAIRTGSFEILPAGCSLASGQQALSWVQARVTQEYVDGEWVFSSELGDIARVNRRTDLLFAMLAKLKTVASPFDLASLAEQFGESIVLSNTLGIPDAVEMAWDLRSRSASEVTTMVIPTEPDPLPDGSFAVRATSPLQELLNS